MIHFELIRTLIAVIEADSLKIAATRFGISRPTARPGAQAAPTRRFAAFLREKAA